MINYGLAFNELIILIGACIPFVLLVWLAAMVFRFFMSFVSGSKVRF